MSAKHTPGPWLWQHSGDGDGCYAVWTRQPHTGDLASVNCEDINGKYPAKANAILMAAAPDLLEALRPLAECEIIECEPPLPDSDSARYFMTMGEIRAARAAIAKALAK